MTCDRFEHGEDDSRTDTPESSADQTKKGPRPRSDKEACQRAVYRLVRMVGKGKYNRTGTAFGVTGAAIGRWARRGYIPQWAVARAVRLTGLPASTWRPDLE